MVLYNLPFLCVNLFYQPSLVALALLALAVEEQHESELVEALRDSVKDLQLRLGVSVAPLWSDAGYKSVVAAVASFRV